MSLDTLDTDHRLVPWAIKAHKEYVVGENARKQANSPDAAKTYLKTYEKKEAEADKDYANQEAFYEQIQDNMGIEEPEPFTRIEKLDWHPKGRAAPKPDKKPDKKPKKK